jgi:hypothetical protein
LPFNVIFAMAFFSKLVKLFYLLWIIWVGSMILSLVLKIWNPSRVHNHHFYTNYTCTLPSRRSGTSSEGGNLNSCISISPLLRLRVAATAKQGRGFRGIKEKGAFETPSRRWK